jgi:acylpyruvate hydrolase
MRYVTFEADGGPRLGAVLDDAVVDIPAAAPDAPKSMKALIGSGKAAQTALRETISTYRGPRHALSQCHLLPPILDAGKFICLGLNYADHAKEGGHTPPEYPSLFFRAGTSLIGPGQPMIVPSCSERLDYEAELVIVIGKRCRHVSEAAALDAIFGYTLFNDGSVRDYQRRTTQWTAGKNFDGTGSLGPWIVTADELPDGARGLGIRCLLNGQTMQSSNTDKMIFSVCRTIEILSEIMTLEAGDLIATGTPEGVGHARTPPVWMRPGDEVTVEIDRIGSLTNPIAAEVPVRDAAMA